MMSEKRLTVEYDSSTICEFEIQKSILKLFDYYRISRLKYIKCITISLYNV